MEKMENTERVILYVQKLKNEQLVSILKEVYSDRITNDTDIIYKIIDNDHWKIGLDRHSFIVKCIEYEILDRIKNDSFSSIIL